MAKKDEGKSGEMVPREDTFVSRPLTPKPTGGRISNAVARVRSWSTATTHRAKQHELEAQTELYNAAVEMGTALERAKKAEVRYNALPEIMAKETEQLSLRMKVEHDETMQSLRNRSSRLDVEQQEVMQALQLRADRLELSKAQADFAIEKGLHDIQRAREHMTQSASLEPVVVDEATIFKQRDEAMQKVTDSYNHRLEYAQELRDIRHKNATSDRDRAVADAHYAKERDDADREYNKQRAQLMKDL